MESPISIVAKLLQSATARMILIGMLTIFLLIPLAFVNELIQDRSQRQQEVVNEITAKWGEEVRVSGPVLKIPYRTYEESVSVVGGNKSPVAQRKVIVRDAYFFPETLYIDADVNTQFRSRSTYDAVVYTSTMDFKGTFIPVDFSSKGIPDEDVLWEKATFVINTTNLKGIKKQVTIETNRFNASLEPVYAQRDKAQSLESTVLPKDAAKSAFSFKFSITYDGSSQLMFVPIGRTTTASVKSNWSDPKFSGHYLPAENRTISEDGFSANWKILHINRPFTQQYFGDLPELSEFAFGVDFYIQADQYQQNERAAKYGFLVIGLTFLTFFLIQTISKIRIHIFQYTMIGLALVMFYTLLISITEHSNFSTAYLISATAVIVLIGLYSTTIIRSQKFPLLISGSLAALYSFIFLIIRLEEYALLVGSIGLFAILAAVMYISRKIEWT